MHVISPNLWKSSKNVKNFLTTEIFPGYFLLLCFKHPCRQKPRSWRMPRPISACHPRKSSWRRRDTQQQARACRTWGAAPSAKTPSRFPLWSAQQNLPRTVSSQNCWSSCCSWQGWDLGADFASFSIPIPCGWIRVRGWVYEPSSLFSVLLQSSWCLWKARRIPS